MYIRVYIKEFIDEAGNRQCVYEMRREMRGNYIDKQSESLVELAAIAAKWGSETAEPDGKFHLYVSFHPAFDSEWNYPFAPRWDNSPLEDKQDRLLFMESIEGAFKKEAQISYKKTDL